MVCARFSQDGQWYRAEVLKMITKDIWSVRYSDFSNLENRSREDLNPFHPSLMKYPIQAMPATFDHTNHIVEGQRLTDEHVRLFEPLLMKVTFFILYD